jgi:hypothetical protein
MSNTSIAHFDPASLRGDPAVARWRVPRRLALLPLLPLLAIGGALAGFLVLPQRGRLPPAPPIERELTFEERWEPVAELRQAPIAVKTSRTVPAEPPPPPPLPVMAVEVEPVPAPLPAVAPRIRPRPPERDVCGRHNMHKVYVSRWSWRCRK